MSTFHLKTSQVLQGDFQLKELNLLVVFQVNCPGCFLSALPLAETLYQSYGAGSSERRSTHLNILGLSTAFEDFDLNTADHTRSLLDTGDIIGATKLYFSHHGQTSYTMPISFPVAFDQVGRGADLFDDTDVEHLCHLTPSFPTMEAAKQARVRHRVQQALCSQRMTGYTFSLNQLQGTPSWILFDGHSNILAQWFGHKSEAEIVAMIDGLSDPTSVSQAIA